MRFRLGPYPVMIRASILLVGALVGAQFATRGDWLLALLFGGTWMGAIIVGVLTHELGHAVMVRRYGGEPTITIFAFGGFTQWAPDPEQPLTDRQRFVVAAAGSAAQLTVAFAVYALARVGVFGPALAAVFDRSPFAFPDSAFAEAGFWGFAMALLVYVGMVWSLFNWLPIRGLDGYHMLGAVLLERMPAQRAVTLLNGLSVGVGLIAGGLFALRGDLFIAFFIVWITLGGLRSR